MEFSQEYIECETKDIVCQNIVIQGLRSEELQGVYFDQFLTAYNYISFYILIIILTLIISSIIKYVTSLISDISLGW